MTFGHTRIERERVASTMELARAHYLATGENGVIVSAQQQTAGRGRLGRPWFTPPNGTQLAVTAVGDAIPLADAWQVALVAGVALCCGIRESVPGLLLQLRFPNDLYLNGKKLGGILVETVPASGGRVVPLIGYGINVNLRADDFPEELRERATSVLRETGEVAPLELGETLLQALTQHWDAWRGEGFAASILPAWHTLLDPDGMRLYFLDGETVTARVVRLAADGQLQLRCADGTERWTMVQQVTYEAP